MPPLPSQSPARLFGQFLLNNRSLFLTSLLLPPKGGGQEVINLFIVNQSEFLQDGHFDRAASQFLHWKELVYRLEDPDIIVFFHIVIVEESSVLPYGHSIIGHIRAGGTKTESRVLPDAPRV